MRTNLEGSFAVFLPRSGLHVAGRMFKYSVHTGPYYWLYLNNLSSFGLVHLDKYPVFHSDHLGISRKPTITVSVTKPTLCSLCLPAIGHRDPLPQNMDIDYFAKFLEPSSTGRNVSHAIRTKHKKISF